MWTQSAPASKEQIYFVSYFSVWSVLVLESKHAIQIIVSYQVEHWGNKESVEAVQLIKTPFSSQNKKQIVLTF